MTAEPVTSDSSVLDLRVVLDTNAIYTASAGHLLAYDTRKLIQEIRGDEHLHVSWYLPQVVLDERRYQLEREAIKLRADVKKLEKVIRHRIPMDDNFIRDRIAKSIAEQVQENSLLVCQANPSAIDWAQLMSDAVTRTPPFDPEVEKGFRDALILEALKQLVTSSSTEPSPCRFAFVRIPAKLNAQSGDSERGFRASRTLIGAKRRRQWVSGSSSLVDVASSYGLCSRRQSA